MTQDENSIAHRQRKPISKDSHRLTARTVATAKPGRLHDGRGLFLVTSKSGSSSCWKYRFTRPDTHRVTETGLGSTQVMTLAGARARAQELRCMVAAGNNPIASRRRDANRQTFGECADSFIIAKESGWRSEKHRLQWRQSLETYAAPLLAMPVDQVTTQDVLALLKPIWKTIPETASRVRGRVEAVLDAAKAEKLRSGENPAAWRGNLAHLLHDRSKIERKNFEAMPYKDVPRFIAELRRVDTMAARALEFLILTASRTGEVLGARWNEIDLEAGVWTIPASRMKSGQIHRVPISSRCAEILEKLTSAKFGEFVFEGRRGMPLSSQAMLTLIRKMNEKSKFTIHGFRSAMSDWASESTMFQWEVVEGCLSHVTGNAVARSYRRGDVLEKRRAVLAAWSTYCSANAGADIIPLRIA